MIRTRRASSFRWTAALGQSAWGLCCAALLAGSASAQIIYSDGVEPRSAEAAGGSNFHWYRLGPGCEREPFGIVANYHEPGVRSEVRRQLKRLLMAGQRRISTGIFHRRLDVPALDGRASGTVLDSSAGRLHPQIEQNLVDFLEDIRSAGFAELLFRYFPQGRNDVRNQNGFDDSLRDENWSLIDSIEPLLRASGLQYRTDLMAEGMPRAREIGSFILPDTPSQGDWSRYARTIWQRYIAHYGRSTTVGFSFVSDIDDTRMDARVEHLDYVYEGRPPAVLAFSLYGNAERDEAWIFSRYRQHLVDEGWADTGWIIAETYFNDESAAKAIFDAINNTGQRVWYLTQWPLKRGSTCSPDVTEAPPIAFDAWRRWGF